MANYTLKKVDDELWKKVKIAAIQKGKTIQNYIVELLRKELIKK